MRPGDCGFADIIRICVGVKGVGGIYGQKVSCMSGSLDLSTSCETVMVILVGPLETVDDALKTSIVREHGLFPISVSSFFISMALAYLSKICRHLLLFELVAVSAPSGG